MSSRNAISLSSMNNINSPASVKSIWAARSVNDLSRRSPSRAIVAAAIDDLAGRRSNTAADDEFIHPSRLVAACGPLPVVDQIGNAADEIHSSLLGCAFEDLGIGQEEV